MIDLHSGYEKKRDLLFVILTRGSDANCKFPGSDPVPAGTVTGGMSTEVYDSDQPGPLPVSVLSTPLCQIDLLAQHGVPRRHRFISQNRRDGLFRGPKGP